MKSIKTQFTFIFCTVLAVSLILVAIGAIWEAEEGMVEVEYTALSMKLDGDIESTKQYLKSFDSRKTFAGDSHDFVDTIKAELNVEATLFVRDGDDFVRISTSIVKDDGKRATGTYLGKESAAYPSMVSGERFRGQAVILGENYLTVYEPIVENGETSGILFAGFKMTEVDHMIDSSIMRLRMIIGIGSLVMLLIGGLVTYWVSKKTTDPIIQLVGVTDQIAHYDLSEQVPVALVNRKDEIGQMALSIEQLQNGLRHLVEEIATSSRELGLSSEQLNQSADQSATTAEEVAQTLNEIAENATEQAGETGQSVDQLDMLGDLIEKDRQEIETMNEATRNVRTLVGDGLEIVNELIDATRANGEAAAVVYESIKKTNDSSSNIGDASHLIASIADQTNLLALNAAIEAARAGEHGRGFAVVADEIRKLAEQSTQSTKNIDEMVETLKRDAVLAVEKMEEAGAIVQNQEQCVRMTEAKYKEIMTAMGHSESIVERLTASSEEMEIRKGKVQEATHALSSIAQENAAATEEASAGMEEQTAAVQEVASSSGVLKSLADQLEQLIQQFKLK